MAQKPNAVWLSGDGNRQIARVYAPSVQAKIKDLTEVYPVYLNPANLAEHETAAAKAVYGFATWGMPVFSEDEIRRYFPNLKVVLYAAGSVQAFARPFLNSSIQVCSAAPANGVPVAEYTLAQILLANKGYFPNARLAQKDTAKARLGNQAFPGNYQVKVGLLGAGVIGRKVIELLKPFMLEVLVFDPFLPDERACELGVTKASLETIFSTCQTISNHLANLPATRGILNKSHFSRMLPNATFINTGRGAQVIEADLIEALRQEPSRTAVLDVTDPEPPLPDSPLRQLDNVVLTTHIAGSMGQEVMRMAEYMLDELQRAERGEPLRYAVTLKMLETMA